MTAAPCACCESAAARERVAIAGIAFEKCASCGLLERPADDAKPPAAWPGCDSAEGAFRLLELIGGPGRVALAGRADSRLLAALAWRGARVCAFEMDADRAHAAIARGFDVTHGTPATAPRADRFDLFFVEDLLERAADPLAEAAAIAAHLAPGGRARIEVPNAGAAILESRGAAALPWFADPPARRLFTGDALTHLLARAGFTEVALTHKAGRRAARLAMKADPFPASMLEAARETLVIRPALLVAVARAH